jgi:hypothetical protein
MKILRVLGATFVVGMGACFTPATQAGPSKATPAMRAAATDTSVTKPPVVQVRAFSNSSVVSVVAWDANNAEIGLRTSVTRSGAELIGRRLGDHSLYMDPVYARGMGGFKYASVTMREILLGTREERDVYSCFYGKECSPMTTVGVRIPDSILRANQDSLVVTFFPAAVEPWTITLHRGLISAYLKTVDSVVAELRTNTTR